MAGEGRLNRSGFPMFHLRRIGPPATKRGVADIMDFFEVTTMIGKSTQSHYVIDSASDMRRSYISRSHARVVIRTPGNDHMLFDDSMNGMFINNLKIVHSVVLNEGDRVTFGHPQGARIPGGVRKLQPDSEYQFLFEKCTCTGQMIVSNRPPDSGSNFVVPEVPVPAGRSSSKKRDRNTTRTLTTKDVLKLKKEFEQQSCRAGSTAPPEPSSRTLAKSDDQSDCPPMAEDNSTRPSVSSNESKQNSNGDASHTDLAEGSRTVVTEGTDTEISVSSTSNISHLDGPQNHDGTLHAHLAEDSSTIVTERMDTETTASTTPSVNLMDGPQNLDDAEHSSSVATSEMNTEAKSTASSTTPSLCHKESQPNLCDTSDACFAAEDSFTTVTEGMNTEISTRADVSVSHMEDPQNPDDDDVLQTCSTEGSSSVAQEEMGREARATTEQKTVSESTVEQDERDNTLPAEREIFLQQEKVQIVENGSDKGSGAECSRNSVNLSGEDSLEPYVNVPDKNSIDSASLSKEDSNELVVNLPNNDIPSCREIYSHIHPSPHNTSTPKSKKTVPNRRDQMEDDASVSQEKSSSKTSSRSQNEAQSGVPFEKVSQMDAAIQTSPLILLVDELSMSGSQQRRQDSADPVQYEEEDPIMCHQDRNKGLQINDQETELEGDSDIKSCASQSTDSAECPTEIIVSDSIDYSGMFEDSDMDEDIVDDSISVSVGDVLNETREDLDNSRTVGNTKEVFMDILEVDDMTEHVSDDVNKTALVSDDLDDVDKTAIVSNGQNDPEELLNKTDDTSCNGDVEMRDEVQFDKTENMSENFVFMKEVDQTENLNKSDCDLRESQLHKTENISADNVDDKKDIDNTVVKMNRSVTPVRDINEIIEKSSEDDVNLGEDDVNPSENNVNPSGDDVNPSGDVNPSEDVSLSEDNVDCSEDDVNLGENNVNLSEDDVSLGEDVDPSEDDVNINEDDGNLSEDDVNIDEDDGNLSEDDVNLSEDDVNLGEDVNLGVDDVNLGEDDGNLGEDDGNLGEDDVNLGESDVNLGEDDVNLCEDDINPSEDDVNPSESDVNLGESDGNLGKDNGNLNEDDGNLGEDDGNLGEDDDNLCEDDNNLGEDDQKLYHNIKTSNDESKYISSDQRNIVMETCVDDEGSTSTDNDNEVIDRDTIRANIPMDIDTLNNNTSGKADLDKSEGQTLDRIVVNQDDNSISENIQLLEKPGDDGSPVELSCDNLGNNNSLRADEVDGNVVLEIHKDNISSAVNTLKHDMLMPSQPVETLEPNSTGDHAENSLNQEEGNSSIVLTENSEAHAQLGNSDNQAVQEINQPQINCNDSQGKICDYEDPSVGDTDVGNSKQETAITTEEKDGGNKQCLIEHGNFTGKEKGEDVLYKETIECSMDMLPSDSAKSVSGLSTVPNHPSSSDYSNVEKVTQYSQGHFKVVSVQGCCDGTMVQQGEETDIGKEVNDEQIQQSDCSTSSSISEEFEENCDLRKQCGINILSSNPDKNCLKEHQDMQAENVIIESQTSVRNYLPPTILDDFPSEGNVEAKRTDIASAEPILDSFLTDGSMKPEIYGGTPMEEISEYSSADSSMKTEVGGTTPAEEMLEDFPTEGSMENGTGIVTLEEQKVEKYPTDGNLQSKIDCIAPEEQILDGPPIEGSVETMTDCISTEGEILDGLPAEGSGDTMTDCISTEGEILDGLPTEGSVETVIDCITPEEQILDVSPSVETKAVCIIPEEQTLDVPPTEGSVETDTDCISPEEQILDVSLRKGSVETETDCMTPEEQTLEVSPTKGSVETENDCMTPEEHKDFQTEESVHTDTECTTPSNPILEDSLTDGSTEAMTIDEQSVEDSRTGGSMETVVDSMTPTETVLEVEGFPANGNMEAKMDDMNYEKQILESCPGEESEKTELEDTFPMVKSFDISNGVIDAKIGNMIQAEQEMEDLMTDGNTQVKTDMTPEEHKLEVSLTEGTAETKSDCITPADHVFEDSPTGQSKETESDVMAHAEEILEGSLSVERSPVHIQEGSMTEWRMNAKADNITSLDQALENTPTRKVEAKKDDNSDICVVSEPCTVGSTSPISKNIHTLQDFGKSISPIAQTTENYSSEDVFLSPASKRLKDREDASDMISCLEDSITSVDNISDFQDVSMSREEIKDIPPVFILDKQFLEENFDGKDQTSSSKSIMESCGGEDQQVPRGMLIARKVVAETGVLDTTQAKNYLEKLSTNEKCSIQGKESCKSPTKIDLVNHESIAKFPENRTSLFQGMNSGKSHTDNDKFVANEGSSMEEKLSSKDKCANNIGMDIESTSKSEVRTETCATGEGSFADSHQESSLEFSSLPQTDSYTSQFSESDLVCQWEVDNRKLDSACARLVEGASIGVPVDEPCPADVSVCAAADVTATLSANGSGVILDVSTGVSSGVPEDVSAVVSEDVSIDISTDIHGVHVSTGMSYDVPAGLWIEETVRNADIRSPQVISKEKDLVDEAEEIQPSGQESLSPDTKKQCADIVMKNPCSEIGEITEQDTEINIKDSCPVETNQETDLPLDRVCNGKLAPRKRKRTFSDSTLDDASHTGKKKKTAWYQNVRANVSNFFNIRYKVQSSKKSAYTKQRLKRENIARIIKHFFSYKKKHTESQRTSVDDTNDSHRNLMDGYSDTSDIEGEADMESQITSKEKENMDNGPVQKTNERISESSSCVSGTNSVLKESSVQIPPHSKGRESETGSEELEKVSTSWTDLAHKADSEEFKVLSAQSSQDKPQDNSSKFLDENVSEMITDIGQRDNLTQEEALVVVNDCHVGNLCILTGSQSATEIQEASSADMEIEIEVKIQSKASELNIPEKSSCHGDVDDSVLNDSDVSGQSQGFSPRLSSESEDQVGEQPEDFVTQTSVDEDRNIETGVQKCTETNVCDIISNENISARCQEENENRNKDFTLDELSTGSEDSNSSMADSQLENSESLLAPIEALISTRNKTQICEDTEEEHESNNSDSESLLAPVASVVMESSTECERNLTSDSREEKSLSELSTNKENDDTDHYWNDHAESTPDSDSLVASVVHTGFKSSLKVEGSLMKTEDSQTVAGKNLFSSIPILDPEGKTYSLSDMDSSDISIITLRSSEELECWGGSDLTEEDVKGRSNMLDKNQNIGYENKFNSIKEAILESPINAKCGRDRQFRSKLSEDQIDSPEICGNNSKLSADNTPLDETINDQMDSMVTVNNSEITEQNTEYTDVSSINYCPLPDFETDSSIDITTSVVESVPTYVASRKTEIVISDSSDELPEVVFLREERKNMNVHVKSEFTDEVIVKQESLSREFDSSESTTKEWDVGSKPVVQAGLDSPLQLLKTTSYLPGRVLNSPMSELSTSTPLSSLEDQPMNKKKNSPRKRTKKRSPVKCKVETPEKKNTPSKYKRRPRRKKNKIGNKKCCDDDIIELITDSDSDDDGPSNSKFSSPINSAQKRCMLNQNETRIVGLSPAKNSCKANDLQDDLTNDLVDDIQVEHQHDPGTDEKVGYSESGRESSVQDIFNSEEFCEDSSLPHSFSEEMFWTIKGFDAATEKTSSSIDGGDKHTATEAKDLESDDTTPIQDRITNEDPADYSDEFSCQGDPTMGDCPEESMDDDDDDDDVDPSHISPPPPHSSGEDDDDVIPNTCDEDDDMDMNIPVLPPLSPLEPLGADTPSQCLSPVFPDVTKTFEVEAGTGEEPVEGASKMFDSDEEFSVPDMDIEALEDSDEKMDEESRSSKKDNCEEIEDVEDDSNDDVSPLMSQRHNDRDDRSITNTPRPDDFAAPSTSSSFKRRALFSEDDGEMDDTPTRKRARTNCTSKMPFTKTSPASRLKKAFDEDMLVSTQCPLVTDMSDSEFDSASKKLLSAEKNTDGSAKKRKAKEFLVNVQAKLKKYKTKKTTPVQPESAPSSQETPGDIPVASSVQRRILTEAEVSNGRITDYLTRCKDVISKLRQALNGPKLCTFPRVSQWRKDLSEVEDKTVLPKTTIAVVGDTGSGKSSLMNAVIDQHNTLPTSGMRACTAVVVEVLANTTSSNYEADIKFLSHKEWFDELQLLISDLTTADGKLKKSVPDQDSEAGVAFLKVKAVYGKVDTMAALSRLTAVTRMLDQVKTIRASNPKDFRRLIDRYIETADPGAGGQFWPIVKQVTIRMPNCDACSSGAILVDLPGVRDSNAARDRIARNYLKNCTVVWVVAAIHRAINNKTAKDMLGENFRRQLLMDGQYGSVAFICTKSDDIMPSEIMRNLKLHDACESSENEIQSLLMEKEEADKTVRKLKKEIRAIGKDVKELTSDIADMKETIEETTSALDGDVIDLDIEGGDGMESLKELRLVLVDKEESLRTIQGEKADKEKGMDRATRESLEIDKKIELKRKEISAFCAKARNDYSKSQIKRDFKAGLREMKRKAAMTNEDDEMEDEDQDYNSDDDDEEIGQTAENLKVFCVSSMEYQKMKNLLTNDGPPNVFSSTEETQIPMLRRYIHELTSVRGQQHVDRLIRSLGQFVFDVQSYIMADGTTCKGTRRDAKSAVEENSKELEEKFEPVLARLRHEIEQTFCNSIETKMADGVTLAMSSANDTASKWGAKQNKEERGDGGLHWKTYQCTVRRQGVYNSKTYGNIDFNEQLSEPMYRCISVCWDKVFSGLLWRALEDCKSLLLLTLTTFVRELCEKLNNLEVPRNQTDRVSTQLCHSAKDKLAEMLTNLKELVLSRQRDISRVITPTVQDNLDQTYSYCGGEAGSGMFMRMKQAMAGGVDFKRRNMFDQASRTLLQELEELKEEIVSHVRSVCVSLCLMLQAAFEPLWEAPSQTKLLKDILFESITDAVLSVTSLHTDANLSLPVAPARDPSPERGSPSPGQTLSDSANQDPNVNDCFPGPSGLQVATTTPVGPQMYTRIYGMTQTLMTDAHGKAQQVSMETSKSTQVTDVLKHLKQEPGSSKVLSFTSVKKEWEAPSNLKEVSGPELRWLQNSIPNLDLGQSNSRPKCMDSSDLIQPQHRTHPVISSRSGLSPQVSSTITQPAGSSPCAGTSRSGLSPQVTSTVTQSAGSLQSTGNPRSGLSPRVSSTITQSAGNSQSAKSPRFGLPHKISSTMTQPAGNSQSARTPRLGLPHQVTSIMTQPAGSSQSARTPRLGLSPRVSSAIPQPAGSSQSAGTPRSRLQDSSITTQPTGISQSGDTPRYGLLHRVSSTITQPVCSSQSLGHTLCRVSPKSSSIKTQSKEGTQSVLLSRIQTGLPQSQLADPSRYSVHSNISKFVTAPPNRIVKPNSVTTSGVHQSADCTAKRQGTLGLGTSQTDNSVRGQTVSAINNLLQKGISFMNPSEVTTSAVGASRSQGNKQTMPKEGNFSLQPGGCKNVQPQAGIKRGNIPTLSPRESQNQATNIRTAVQVGKNILSALSSSDVSKTLVSIVNKSLLNQLQTKQQQSSSTSSSHSFSGSPSTGNRSPTVTNSSPVTGATSSSNKGRLRLSLRKSAPDSPSNPCANIKQELVEEDTGQQRRVRRANNNNYGLINLCDSSDSEN